MSSIDHVDVLTELLIYGYIHELEKSEQLFTIIPEAIYGVVILFYPQLLKFELFSAALFELLDGGYEIKGIPNNGCSSYTIFAECLSPDGYNRGIHYWSVKLLGDSELEDDDYCYHSIGVIANKRDKKWCDQSSAAWSCRKPATQVSYYRGDTFTSIEE